MTFRTLWILLVAFSALTGGFQIYALGADNSQYKFMHLTVDDGLSNNQVKTILKDRQGFIWFGTGSGLDRFDGTNFRSFRYNPSDKNSIPFSNIDFLLEDADGKIWIQSLTQFCIYDPVTEMFNPPGSTFKNMSVPLTGLRTLFCDSKGNTWFIKAGEKIYKYNHATGKIDSASYQPPAFNQHINSVLNGIAESTDGFIWTVSNSCFVQKINSESLQVIDSYDLSNYENNEQNSFVLSIDNDNDIWVYAKGQPLGTILIKSSTRQVVKISDQSPVFKLNNNLVSSVVDAGNGKIWIGTDHGGINIIDKKTGETVYLVNHPEDSYSVSQNSINVLYHDPDGIIWAGTYKNGVNYYHPNLVQFQWYRHIPSMPESLPFNDVNCFVEDKSGNLWIGTNGDGLIYFNRKDKTFRNYRHNPADPNSLGNNIIITLHFDHDGQLWIGSYFGGIDRFDGTKFHHYRHNPTDDKSLSDDRVYEIFEDSQRNLWIGTLNGGLNLFDRQKTTFTHYLADQTNSVSSNFVVSVLEDSQKNLWIGTNEGINYLDRSSGRFSYYMAAPGEPGELSDNYINDLHEDSNGLIWVGTAEGLNVFSKQEKKFRSFSEANGLSNNNIRAILEDQRGNLWLSTNNGISKISILNFDRKNELDSLKIKIINYDTDDGLQGKEFNLKAAYRTRAGELIFGGANGFNLFIPETIKDYIPENKILLTRFKIFNEPVKAGLPFRGRKILDESITGKKEITLRYLENVFSVEFAALNFINPEKNEFEYLLENFNKEWIKLSAGQNEFTFTNLSPGEYSLRIRVSNNGGDWREMEQPLAIIVTPPFWRSNYAYILYILLIAAGLFAAREFLLERQQLKFNAEQEHRESLRIQQLDALKTKFFTNISHEFRTPLTLIISPIEKMLAESESNRQNFQLILIHRHAKRLLSMVNQLLDFRKLDYQEIEEHKSWGDLVELVQETGLSFQDLADHKQIEYSVMSEVKTLLTAFDHDKLEKIVSNLLSNAFKFTPQNGKITLNLKITNESLQKDLPREIKVKITVSDTGIGIAPEKQQKVFDRFYQDELPGTMVNQGTGIGLSMVKEYINMMGGDISLQSEINRGSDFTVTLPVILYSEEAVEQNIHNPLSEKSILKDDGFGKKQEVTKFDPQKKTILIVDDNDDFRFYLKDNLRNLFNIIDAGNGVQGWNLVLKHLPDLVVSDVMMPGMNGTDLCRKIKIDGRTSHIPVVLLTAKVESEATLEGFKAGADDYITKPFDFRILESRIENIAESRERLRASYQTMLGLRPEKIEADSLDSKFIKKALEIVEKNMDNADFSVEDLSQKIGMSRVSLYKKLSALTKRTPVEFIRIIRMKRAADLLENSQYSVSEIAFKVGFNNPRYFTSYFKEEYNMLPSEYIAQHRKIKDKFTNQF